MSYAGLTTADKGVLLKDVTKLAELLTEASEADGVYVYKVPVCEEFDTTRDRDEAVKGWIAYLNSAAEVGK